MDIPYQEAHDEHVNETETLEAIGNLIQVARMEVQQSQLSFSKEIGLHVQTIRAMEKGERMVQSVAQAKVERGLGWRIGAIREIWEDRENLAPEQVTLEEMRRGAEEASFRELEHGDQSPVMKASLLSDEELLAEIAYRFRNYKVQLNGES